MTKRWIFAAGCGIFTSLVFVCAAQAQSAQEFVNKVAISDMFEIQSSRLALTKQPDKDTKPFAEKMVRDHQKTSNELKSLVDSGKVKAKLPTVLDSEHQQMLDELKAKGAERTLTVATTNSRLRRMKTRWHFSTPTPRGEMIPS